jgi:2-polyprenyl-3-methyl-5-hydroxy-6-metoxy-1,4-benzoquinol methylase
LCHKVAEVLSQRVRETFAIDESLVAALPATQLADGSSQERYAAWRASTGAVSRSAIEYLLPRVEVDILGEWPEYMTQRRHLNETAAELGARIEQLGPWEVAFRLAHGLSTMADDMVAAVSTHRFLYRLDLVNATVAKLLGDDLAHTTVLDIGCHSGLFSLDIAARGARRVDGVDLRAHNIAQAEFVADRYGIDNARFQVRDADEIVNDETWDVVFNLGLLYHVLNPFHLIKQTYELCRSFAVIDTVCHTEPVSAFFVMGDKDIQQTSEGKAAYEFHPTYRAVIDAIRYAGFSDIIEVTGRTDHPHDIYATGNRRCFLAIK